MSGENKPQLYCVHVIGPDDIYAAPDARTAAEWALYLSIAAAERINPPGTSGDDFVMCYANVVEWAGSAEAHAEYLPKSIAGMTPKSGLRLIDPRWAPIAKARKDGTWYLLCGPDGQATARWRTAAGSNNPIVHALAGKGGYWQVFGSAAEFKNPTLCMRLPLAPAGTEPEVRHG